MIANVDNRFGVSTSPHSLGLRNNMTIPNPGWDSNSLLITEKSFWGRGMQGISGLSFDGSGFLGTGLFAGDYTTWGVGEIIFGVIGAYAVYTMFFHARGTKQRLVEGAGRRRKSRASSLRAKAKRLEEQTEGIF